MIPHELFPDPSRIKEDLQEQAQRLGFSRLRVTTAGVASHRDEYLAWLDSGAHGTMGWLERDPARRSDPDLVLPGVRSVIVVSMNYWQGTNPRKTTGRIARYAWGEDYHDLMLGRLRQLETILKQAGGTQKCYVDTGPMLERDFAAESGIGWHGKSTMLLNEELGTWFFLGEILTTIGLPPDAPVQARCGTCTRCITACPTGAITEAHRVDARLCVSYLTIENHGAIPEALRPMIGDRIYGCDDCLDACPWNRFAKQSREVGFAMGTELADLSLNEMASLDDDAFRRLFQGSPIKRIKRPRFIRNVCVALGNVGTVADLEVLERLAEGSDPLISEHALWAIGQILGRNAPSPLPSPQE